MLAFLRLRPGFCQGALQKKRPPKMKAPALPPARELSLPFGARGSRMLDVLWGTTPFSTGSTRHALRLGPRAQHSLSRRRGCSSSIPSTSACRMFGSALRAGSRRVRMQKTSIHACACMNHPTDMCDEKPRTECHLATARYAFLRQHFTDAVAPGDQPLATIDSIQPCSHHTLRNHPIQPSP